MREKPTKLAAILCVAAMSLSLCACGGETEGDDITGHSAGQELKQSTAADDIFTLNYNTDYSMNPLTATNTNNQLVCNLIYENMIEVDNNFEAIPNVITSWTTEDGKSWTFTVADDRYFHDGSHLTAYDVAYSLRCAANTDRYKSRIYYIGAVSVNDAESFTVSITKVNMQFPKLLSIPVIKDGSFESKFPQGSGPYAISRNHKKLQAYKKYYSYESLPLKTIYLEQYTDVDETMSAFEDSLIDIVMNDPTAPTNLGYGATNEIRGYNTTNLHYIGVNMGSALMQNAAIRAASSLAFDRDTIVTEQMGGYGLPTTQIISPASQYYSTTVNNQNKFSLEKVERIIKNAGLKDLDDDGFLEMRINEDTYMDVTINFVVCGASGEKVNVAHQFESDMEKLGVEVNVNVLSWEAYNEAVDAGNFDLYYGEVRLNSDFDPSRLLCSDGKLNYGSVSDSKLEKYISEYLAAGQDERYEAAETMSAYLCNNAYIIPICFEKHQMITHRGLIEGIKVNENNPLCDFQHWKISFAENISGDSEEK